VRWLDAGAVSRTSRGCCSWDEGFNREVWSSAPSIPTPSARISTGWVGCEPGMECDADICDTQNGACR
jgi:hypothetical protein